MSNELVVGESWIKRNWKWFLPTTLFILLLGFILSSNIGGNATDIFQAYNDNSLYEKAIEKANTNTEVLALIGKIQPIDKLSIMEGNVVYSNNNNSVESSVRIKGTKETGKIDIVAKRTGTKWEYQKITIRIKKRKLVLNVL